MILLLLLSVTNLHMGHYLIRRYRHSRLEGTASKTALAAKASAQLPRLARHLVLTQLEEEPSTTAKARTTSLEASRQNLGSMTRADSGACTAPACKAATMDLLEETGTKLLFQMTRLTSAFAALQHALEDAAVIMGVYDYINGSSGMDSLFGWAPAAD